MVRRMLLRHSPAPPLDAFVDVLWASDRGAMPHARERNLPTGRADLIIALRQTHLTRFASAADMHGQRFAGGIVQGPQQLPFFRETGEPSSVVGVHFRAGGAAALFGVPLTELSTPAAPDELWGTEATALRDHLQALHSASARLGHLEAWLLSRLHRAPQRANDAPIAWALRAFEGSVPCSVAEVRGALGWSPKRFIAEFSQRVGLTPKRYLRIARFQRIVQAAARCRTLGTPIDWAALALAEGCADQAHLVREFRSFSGLTPSGYHPLAPDQASHTAEKIFKTPDSADAYASAR
jgi:AraC-like DNA-binding protein